MSFVSPSFLNTLQVYLTSNEIEDADLLTQIEHAQKNYQWRMPKSEFIGLLEQIQARYDKPALGFRIGRCLSPEHYGMVGYLATSCSSLGQALQRYQQHLSLVDSSLDTRYSDVGNQRLIRWWHNEANSQGIWGEFGLMVFINFYQALIGKDIAPSYVELTAPCHGDPKIYEMLCGCPVKFGCDAIGIALPKSLYALKISSSDPFLRQLYDRQALALHQDFLAHDPFLQMTQFAIRHALPEQRCSATQIAKQLGYSLRTFYRHLDTRGLRYRALIADTRYALAKSYLHDPSLSLAEIALMLGYADQSAFSRAFVAWSAQTPSAYRLQARL